RNSLKAGLLGDALETQSGLGNHIHDEREIGAAMDRTDPRIDRRQATYAPAFDQGARLGAHLLELGVERRGAREECGSFEWSGKQRHGAPPVDSGGLRRWILPPATSPGKRHLGCHRSTNARGVRA